MADQLLHVSDWNMKDKYYSVPKAILLELRERVKKDDYKSVWNWFIEQADYKDASKPVKRLEEVRVDAMDDEFFFDYVNMKESVSEWDEELLAEA